MLLVDHSIGASWVEAQIENDSIQLVHQHDTPGNDDDRSAYMLYSPYFKATDPEAHRE